MRVLEHRLARARLAVRRLRARAGSRSPARTAPARLVFDLSAAKSERDAAPATLRRVLIEMVDWRGPVPVSLELGGRGDHPHAEELVRFAHRLECPTRIVLTGAGVNEARALAFMDRGLESVRLAIGGRSPDAQAQVGGCPPDEADAALAAFCDARSSRRSALDIEVGLRWSTHAVAELSPVLQWASERGADGVRLLPPHSAAGLHGTAGGLSSIPSHPLLRIGPGDKEALEALILHGDDGPGVPKSAAAGPRRFLPCPVGGQRLEVDARGSAYCCPHKPPIGQVQGALRSLWADSGPHLDAIKRCDRACVNVELVPEPWVAPLVASGIRVE